jgi:hypothetical protein
MPFIGNKPAQVPLTSADIADGIITSAKIVDGTIVNADINASAAIVNSKLSGVGITMVDRWRLSSNLTGTNQPITSNLERSDETDAGFIGTGMTESSGIFTFPSTGIYLIQAQFAFQLNGSARYISPALLVTSNNSSYTIVSSTDVFIAQVASLTTYTMAFFSHTFDVTNVTTHKVKFDVESSANVSTATRGTTTSDLTAFTFIRLGDT